jgi:hypothetical protein
MNIGQRNPNQNDAGSTQFLNFSDALHYLRWGERIARRSWPQGKSVVVDYRTEATFLVETTQSCNVLRYLTGTDILAEDWYVL